MNEFEQIDGDANWVVEILLISVDGLELFEESRRVSHARDDRSIQSARDPLDSPTQTITHIVCVCVCVDHTAECGAMGDVRRVLP